MNYFYSGVTELITTGIYYWFGYQIESRERFKLMKEAGFDYAALWWGDEFADYDVDINLLPSMAREVGLEVENVHAPYQDTNYIWTDCIDAEDIVKRYVNCIMDCSRHSIPTVVIHLSSGNTPPPVSQIGLQRIKYLVETAENKNVNVALENTRKIEYLEYVFSNIQSDRLGFCYDSGHENCFSPGADLLSKYGSKLMALHLHDNDGSDDQHNIPGEGTIDWGSTMSNIRLARYKGPITLEITNESSRLYSKLSAQEFLNAAHEKIMNLF